MAQEITLIIERDEQTGWFVATWEDPGGGGITTQGKDLVELQTNIKEAVLCHFDDGQAPRSIRLHFQSDLVLDNA